MIPIPILDTSQADALVGVMMRCIRHVGVLGPHTPEFSTTLVRHMEGRENGKTAASCTACTPKGMPHPLDALMIYAGENMPKITAWEGCLAPQPFLYIFSFIPFTPPDGWRLYAEWRWLDNGSFVYMPPDIALDLSVYGLALCVRKEYDPVVHARQLIRTGHPGWSLELIENVPDTLYRDALHAAQAEAERMLCLLAWDTAAGDTDRLNRFAKAMNAFYRAIALDPDNVLALEVMAHFWKRMNHPEMAARWISTAATARNTPAMTALAQQWRIENTVTSLPPSSLLDIVDISWRPRILLILQSAPDYGVDVLYDGLCDLLGDDAVVDYPPKGLLHGEHPEGMSYYPCLCHRKSKKHSLPEIIAALKQGAFDLILYADTLETLPKEAVRAILSASDTPAFLVDMWDQCGDYHRDIESDLAWGSFRGYFKREMLSGISYPAPSFPLPFAYPAFRIPDRISFTGRQGLFWAGKGMGGLRRMILEHMVMRYGLDISRQYSQEEYTAALARHVAGLSLTGNGFDTVRYWELPAHGCLLLSERLPIIVPNDFVDGVDALFFEDLKTLDEKIRWMQHNTALLPQIAEAGHRRLLQYHTGRVRAAQLLEGVTSILQPG